MPSWKWGQPDDGVIQVAYVVEDLRTAIVRHCRELNIGPWFLFEHFQFLWLKSRGAPATLDISLALAFSGPMMFELIQQNDVNASVYQQVRAQRGGGFHHWAVGVRPERYDQFLRDYEARGYPLVLEGAVAVGARAAYFDTTRDLTGMIEVIEVTPPVEDLFKMVHQASVGWAGNDPIRVLTPPG